MENADELHDTERRKAMKMGERKKRVMMNCTIREWRKEDAARLAQMLNNKKILDNLRDGLPFPYTEKDAGEFIEAMLSADPIKTFPFAITVNDEVIGSIGVFRCDNIHSQSAEMGYYIGEPYWGKGIMTSAVEQICRYIFEQTDIIRIFAEPFAHNAASCRVLEKAGFSFEGCLRSHAVKNGRIVDMKLYSRIKKEELPALRKRTSEEWGRYFEYVDMDRRFREIVGRYKDRVPSKWCISTEGELAFVELEYVASGIVRGNENECYRKYLFLLEDGYGWVSVYHPEHIWGSFTSPDWFWYKKPADCDITLARLLQALEAAMKVYAEGKDLEFKIKRKTERLESLKKTPDKIMHGAFAPLLEKALGSVTEVENLEIEFRNLCLNHFIDWNVKKQEYDGFYLHDDEGSFFLFDVILWAYLHIDSSMEHLRRDWDALVNEKYMYKGVFCEEFVQQFCIGGADRFFFEDYFSRRTQEGKLILAGDVLQLSREHTADIVEKLSHL